MAWLQCDIDNVNYSGCDRVEFYFASELSGEPAECFDCVVPITIEAVIDAALDPSPKRLEQAGDDERRERNGECSSTGR